MELRNVVLVGGGHSNVQVLKILATELKKADRVKIILISEYQYAWYSGMMPGAISGLYKPEEAQMDLAALAQWAKAEFVQARMIGLDIDRRLVLLDGDKQSVYYDYLSVNIGSVTRDTTVIPGVSEFAVATRPISELVNKIERFEQEHEKFDHVPHVVIVGAGAAGVELAFAFNARFRERYGDVAVTLVSAVEKIGHAEMGHWVSRNIRHSLREKRIAVYQGKCVNVSKTHVTLESNETRDLRYDLLVWATGAAAPTVLKSTGLQLDDRGYLLVSQTLQTLTRPEIFASGDCCTVQGCPWITKAGVYSVREGPFVAQNILKLLRGHHLTNYHPQKGFLALMMTGDGSAISSWKGTSATGKLIWAMKDRIDRKFMDLFNVNKLPTNVVNYQDQ